MQTHLTTLNIVKSALASLQQIELILQQNAINSNTTVMEQTETDVINYEMIECGQIKFIFK